MANKTDLALIKSHDISSVLRMNDREAGLFRVSPPFRSQEGTTPMGSLSEAPFLPHG